MVTMMLLVLLLTRAGYDYTQGLSTSSYYKYFAYGSNMLLDTIEGLRALQPINATAAVLPDYELGFEIQGNALIEPSAASVRPKAGAVVHGVVYTLSDSDFARLGWSEGFPFVYRWQECNVYPYYGDSDCAGSASLKESTPVTAYTLCATRTFGKDIPPSPSYLAILRKGAQYWKLDASYQKELSMIQIADNLLIRDGIAGSILELAKLLRPSKK